MIRILFLDTSALMSFFVSDEGTRTMRWLMSADNKAHSSTRYVINNRVIREFESSLQRLVSEEELKQCTAEKILSLFNTHYKNRKFKIVGKEASAKETMDGMYNFLGRLSQPMLVTCNTEQAALNAGYKSINPQTQTSEEIALLLQGKKRPQEIPVKNREEDNFYRRFFKKTRMTLAL